MSAKQIDAVVNRMFSDVGSGLHCSSSAGRVNAGGFVTVIGGVPTFVTGGIPTIGLTVT